MHPLTILLLAISSNLDTLVLGLAYGTKKMRLTFTSNLICALIPCTGTYLMMTCGALVRYLIAPWLANMLGAGIILIAGLMIIIHPFKKTNEILPEVPAIPIIVEKYDCLTIPDLAPKKFSSLQDPIKTIGSYTGVITLKSATLLALALTLNNLSCGLAARLLGLNTIMTVFASFVISLLFFDTGIKLGISHISQRLGTKSDFVAGLILILLAIYELFW